MSFYSLLPPEINSGLIYAGPGEGSLTAAAAAWHGLSEELTASASSVSHVVSGLSGSWTGPSASAMAATTAPFTGWLYDASALAGQMSAQATAQAGFYQTARSAVIPPAAIVANRARLLMLIATNFFGQNSAAIAATEAEYQAYWATDAAVMDSYSSATQANLTSLKKASPPPTAAKPQAAHPLAAGDPKPPVIPGDGGTSAANSGETLGDMLSAIGLQGMEKWMPASWWDMNANTAMMVGRLGYYPLMYGAMPLRYLMMLTGLGRMGAMGAAGAAGLASQGTAAAGSAPTALMTQIGEFVDGKLQGAVGTLVGHFTSATHEISAKLGQAASMGALKVPQAWSMAADGMVRAAPVLPHTTVSAPIQTAAATSGLPGGPFGNALMGAMAGRGLGSVAAKAPKVIPRSPAGG